MQRNICYCGSPSIPALLPSASAFAISPSSLHLQKHRRRIHERLPYPDAALLIIVCSIDSCSRFICQLLPRQLELVTATKRPDCMSPPRHPAEAIEHVDELRDEVTRPASINKSSHSGDAVLESRDATESAMAKPAGDSAPEIEFTSSDTGISGTEKSLDTHPEETDSKDIVNTDDEATSETATTCAGDSNELMETSTATLRPETAPITQPKPLRHENLGDEPYLDPTPPTPIPTLLTRSLSAASVASGDNQKSETAERSPTRSDAGFDERHSVSEDEREKNSKSEIQTIMDQFSEEGGGPGEQEVMSPRLELATPLLGGNIQHPPRKSSLEPLNAAVSNSTQSLENLRIASTSPVSLRSQSISEKGPAVPPKPSSMHGFIPNRGSTEHFQKIETPPTPGGGSSLHRPPPPEPEPEPNLPFDFHRFLEQLRHKTADPVAKFLRSFLTEFGKKQWMVHEQVKIISDFLAFITNKMAQCEVWREVSDAEFDNAREGMEKLVMNRLYTQTFSPAIPPPQPIQGPRSKRKNAERPLGPGRRGQHQEDVERDDILAQKVSIYGWVREEHLDIPPVGESGKRFLVLAQQGMYLKRCLDIDLKLTISSELLKIKTYRAPRDKIICVLNCCKVIFGNTSTSLWQVLLTTIGLLKHSKSDSSADSFMPLLIYVVLQANPEHLVSNVQYILRFRNQEKLGGEAGYYLSSLVRCIVFLMMFIQVLTAIDGCYTVHRKP